MRIAAIDIGTVTCRLLVADVNPGELNECMRVCEITNLGLGVDKTQTLQPDAIDRVVDQVSRYIKIIESYAVSDQEKIPIVAIATSAARDAKNSEILLKELHHQGIELSVISGKREASLSFKGASLSFKQEKIMVVDIGGGSTEIIIGTAQAEPSFSHSFDIGCRRVTERFLRSDPPTPKELDAAKQWVMSLMAPFFAPGDTQKGFEPSLAKPHLDKVERIVAVAGTATSVVSIDKKMKVYDPKEVDKTTVSRATLQRIYRLLARLPQAQRKQVVGLEPKRASVIVAGMLILDVVLELADKETFTVSESDILQGIILDTAAHAQSLL